MNGLYAYADMRLSMFLKHRLQLLSVFENSEEPYFFLLLFQLNKPGKALMIAAKITNWKME